MTDLELPDFGSVKKPYQLLHFQSLKCEFNKAEIIKKEFQSHWVMKTGNESKPESLREPVATYATLIANSQLVICSYKYLRSYIH